MIIHHDKKCLFNISSFCFFVSAILKSARTIQVSKLITKAFLFILLVNCHLSLAQSNVNKQAVVDSIKLLSNIQLIQAQTQINRILNETTADDNSKLSADCYFLLGRIELINNNYEASLLNFENAAQLYNEDSSPLEYANTHNNLGYIKQSIGNYHIALQHYLRAYEIFAALNNQLSLASVCNNLGTLYYLLDQSEKSMSFYHMALSIFTNHTDSLNINNTYANIATIHYNNWQLDSALSYFQLCLQMEERLLDKNGMGRTYNSMSSVYLAKNETAEAEKALEKALILSKKADDNINISSVYESFGLIYKELENYNLAHSYFDSCHQIALNTNNIEQLKSVYLNKSELYEAEEDFEKTLEYFQKYEEVKSSLLIENTLVSETESIFTKQKQENVILQLEKEKEQKKNQVIILIAIIIIVLILGISGFIVFSLSQKRLLEKELAARQKEQFHSVLEAQEQERKRIAGDLHDSVGQMLSVVKLNISELEDFIQPKTDEGELLEKSLNYLDDVCEEVRNISHNLMPGSLIRLGLSSAIKDLIRNINSTNTIKISLDSTNYNNRLKENIEFSLFRISQEIINNAVKHSQATNIDIFLGLQDGQTQLSIKDNGIGFDTAKIENSNGIGWKNIYSRLSLINGKMDVESNKNGTIVNISIKG